MPPRPAFLDFPREVRDMIYESYVTETDGYHFDHESKKLRAADRPIDLSLMYTCKCIAAEMSGLPLKLNVIRFTTGSSESERFKAFLLSQLMANLARDRRGAFNTSKGSPFASRQPAFWTPDVIDEVTRIDPQLLSWTSDASGNANYEAPSIYRENVRKALAVLLKSPDYLPTYNTYTAKFPPKAGTTLVEKPILYLRA